MYKGKIVSVVISTYREKNSVRQVAEDFLNTGYVDEVIIVNNNAEPGTDERIKTTMAALVYETENGYRYKPANDKNSDGQHVMLTSLDQKINEPGVRLIYEPKQGYGHGYRHGIKEATGDYIVLCEADNTYAAEDIERFLVFAKNFPTVFGSRTNTSTLLDTKTMQPMRRYANVIYAKTIEVLYGTTTLTDIGCTYKLFRKETLRKLEPYFKTTDSLFATELQLLAASHKVPFVEIPVTFRERVGKSGTAPTFRKLVYWAIKIWWFIWTSWWRWQWNKLLSRGSTLSGAKGD